MGQTFARYKSRNQRRVLLVGLDAAGKTTLLFRLYSGKTLNTVPTVGYNVKVRFFFFRYRFQHNKTTTTLTTFVILSWFF